MPGPGAPLGKCRVLIVEDEWFLANDLQMALKSLGADAVALVGNIDDAGVLLSGGGFDVGVIDINLRGHNAFGLADELQRQGIPFLFATGYSAEVIPVRFADVTRWEKPFDPRGLAQFVLQLWRDGSEPKPKCPLL
jgi:DNA-binding NtrC family response regulator